MKYEKFCSQLITYFKKTRGIWEQENHQTALRTALETKTTQEKIQGWLKYLFVF